ncbi:MAG TPA: FAD binding domain-containing protein, partial [Polyangia bacterium]|nr:FAD binding domain-containing protein [Polyangia bacterium]
MRPFRYLRPADEAAAIEAVATEPGAAFIGGGTGLVDLMKLDVQSPALLVDVRALGGARGDSGDSGESVVETADGLRIDARARNSDVARHPLIAAGYPALSEALLAGASPQLRNMATVGGNLMQR